MFTVKPRITTTEDGKSFFTIGTEAKPNQFTARWNEEKFWFNKIGIPGSPSSLEEVAKAVGVDPKSLELELNRVRMSA